MLLIFFLIDSRVKPASSSGLPISYNTVKRGTAIGLVAGLGFALLESAVYGASDTGVLLIRAVTAAPLHGACGSRVGAAAVLFRTNPVQAAFRVLTAIAIHGVYDLMVIQSGFPAIAAVLIAISALVNTILTIKGGWFTTEDEPPPVYNWSSEAAPLEQQPSTKSEGSPLEPQPSNKSEGSLLEP